MRQLSDGRVEVKSLGELSFEANGAFTNSVQLAVADRPTLVFGSHELRLAPGEGGPSSKTSPTVSHRACFST